MLICSIVVLNEMVLISKDFNVFVNDKISPSVNLNPFFLNDCSLLYQYYHLYLCLENLIF